ncbi:MAG: hypothetical protein HFG87_07510 [Dorea sp.]|jgi:hypothetical protein|nr:hypothetical protein [Dorea sp.]MCI9228066.1 hypothetical protein [Dorea sp.]
MRYEMEELIPIVAELTERYTGYESTSVTYEKANQLMEAVIYCIQEYEAASPAEINSLAEEAGKTGLAVQNKTAAKEAYRLGCQLVDRKVRAMKEMYHALLEHFQSYGNIALKETLEAVPEFLKWYDSRYEPQNTILTLDYPVLRSLGEYAGIDAVYEYIRCIGIEQRFLGKFPDTYVTGVLRAYSGEYEEMFENLCGIVLADVMWHILLKKPFDSEGMTESDRSKIQAVLGMCSKEEAKENMREMVKNFLREFYEDGEEIWRYVENECDNIVVRAIHTSIASLI